MNKNRKSNRQVAHAQHARFTIRRFEGDELLISNDSGGFVVNPHTTSSELYAVLTDIIDGDIEVAQ